MLPSDIHHAYLQVPHATKGVEYRPAGRFMVQKGQLHILENYHGLLDQLPEGPIDEVTLHALQHPPQGLRTASRSSLRAGQNLELLPEAKLQPLPQRPPASSPVMPTPKPRPPSVWHYTRAGHDHPHLLEHQGGQTLLDGNPLSEHEISTVLQNVRNKVGKIRYVGSSTMIQKTEDQLRKAADMEPQEALQHLAGHQDPKSQDATAALRRHIFEDPMVPGLGNRYAYQAFRKGNHQGATVVGDANFFKQINDTYGHDAGDEAIRSLGAAWRDAANQVQDGKAHRFGGDEFHVHFPTLDHVHEFARNLRSRLETQLPVGGTHRLSMALGVGHDFGTADKALYEAKKQKVGYLPSSVPHVLLHSLYQGHEGAVQPGVPALPFVNEAPVEGSVAAEAPAQYKTAAP